MILELWSNLVYLLHTSPPMSESLIILLRDIAKLVTTR